MYRGVCDRVQRTIGHKGVEQTSRLHKVNEERQLPKRSERRLAIPFDTNRTSKTVEANAGRQACVFNRRLITLGVKARESDIECHDPDNA